MQAKKPPLQGGAAYPSEEGTRLAETASRVREQEVLAFR